jgi:endonuclease I
MVLTSLILVSCGKDPLKYSVEFRIGNATTSFVVLENEKIKTAQIPSSSLEGYEFLGWFVEDELIDLSNYKVTKDVVFTAKYTAIVEYIKVSVIFISKNKEETTVEIPIGSLISNDLIPSSSLDGYEFLGWYLDNERIYLENYHVNSNITLEAKYELIVLENEYENVLYGHTFILSDLNINGGSALLNGLTWNYNKLAFLGAYTYGVQIGSKNNPQKDTLTFTTELVPNAKVLSYTIYLCTASSGDATYTVSFGEYTKESTFNNVNDPYAYGEDELNVDASSFSFSLVSRSRAIYLQRIEILLSLPLDHNLNIVNEEDSVLGPVKINIAPSFDISSFNKTAYYLPAQNKEGNDLLLALRSIISNMTKRSYADAKTILLYTDESVEFDGYLYGLYDGDKIKAKWDSGSSWNREHVWACAQMQITANTRPDEETKNHTSDLHNLRVACGPTNGNHGNLFFNDYDIPSLAITPNVSGLKGTHAYNGDHRGDIARILFYMYARYEGLELNDDLDVNNDVSMGKLSSLLKWNIEDPVDEFEIRRNNRIYEYQGNRNPFIDNPSYISSIFNYNYVESKSNKKEQPFPTTLYYFAISKFDYSF